jgi:hypothetical protein
MSLRGACDVAVPARFSDTKNMMMYVSRLPRLSARNDGKIENIVMYVLRLPRRLSSPRNDSKTESVMIFRLRLPR